MDLSRLTGSWFAIQTKPRVEDTTARLLRTRGYEIFLPVSAQSKRKRSGDRAVPLFPGYLFCRFDSTVCAPIVTTPGVIRIVGYGSQPVCIPDSEMDAIRSVVTAGLAVDPHPYVPIGQWVEVCAGPLAGIVGRVIASGAKNRLVIAITVLQRAVSVELDECWLRPITNLDVHLSGTYVFPNVHRDLRSSKEVYQ